MYGRSCTVVLVGNGTANRKWINHEIVESWNEGMGIVGIRIHGLKDSTGNTANIGGNPFDHITFKSGKKLSEIVKCYNPAGATSQERYDWIKRNLSAAVEEAVKIRSSS
jgi:hypothetical protein